MVVIANFLRNVFLTDKTYLVLEPLVVSFDDFLGVIKEFFDSLNLFEPADKSDVLRVLVFLVVKFLRNEI